jgi:hypothetical protein
MPHQNVDEALLIPSKLEKSIEFLPDYYKIVSFNDDFKISKF